jgi:hypothetical protein
MSIGANRNANHRKTKRKSTLVMEIVKGKTSISEASRS